VIVGRRAPGKRNNGTADDRVRIASAIDAGEKSARPDAAGNGKSSMNNYFAWPSLPWQALQQSLAKDIGGSFDMPAPRHSAPPQPAAAGEAAQEVGTNWLMRALSGTSPANSSRANR
jgi:hypothetical protein